jgi:hypothetical protein
VSIRQHNLGSIIKPGFNPLAAGVDQYKGIWTMQQVNSAVAAGTWPGITPKLFSWGSNTYGQLGLSNVTNYSSPKQIGALTAWSKLSGARFFSSSIKTDGTLWTWGSNGSGRLGLGNTVNQSSPSQVGSLTGWDTISLGADQTLAIAFTS